MSTKSLMKFLASTDARPEILQLLRENPQRACDLKDHIDLSRRNIQRNLVEMAEMGLVRKLDGQYMLTLYGYFVEEIYRDTLSAIDELKQKELAFGGITTGDTIASAVVENSAPISVTDNVTEELTQIERIVNGKFVTCVVPNITTPFAIQLMESLFPCQSALVLADRDLPSKAIACLLESSGLESTAVFVDATDHFVVRVNDHTFIGVRKNTDVKCVAHSDCPRFANGVDKCIEEMKTGRP